MPGRAQDDPNAGSSGDFWSNNPPPAAGTTSMFDAVAGFYKNALGRAATPAEIHQWIDGKSPDQLGQIQQAIYASPEAAAYGAKQSASGGNTTAGKLSDADFKTWFQQATQGKTPNSDTLKSMQAEIEARGGKIALNAAGIAHKITMPGGSIVRVGDHFDSAPSEGFTPQWNWVDGGGGSGSSSGSGSMESLSGRPSTFSSQAYSGPAYQPPELPEWLQSPYVAPTWQGGDFTAPTKPGEIASPFHAPTQAELESSPGYQSRLAAGLQARNRSAAAQGTVLNGGTQQALARYGQDYASNEYGNLYGQNLQTRQQNVGEYNTDYTNAFSQYQTRYGQFMDSANLGFQARQQNFNEYQGQVNNGQQTYQNNYGQYLNDQSRQLNDYLTNLNAQRNYDNDYWSRFNDVANRGVTAAGATRTP